MSETTVSPANMSAVLRTRVGKRAKSVRQFAEDWDLSQSMVWKLIRQKRLKAVKIGARTLITAEHEDEYARSLSQAGAGA